MLDREHRKVWFSGHVQGVGFRFTTHRIAGHYSISGYVQNLPDGRVVVEVEGESNEIERFLSEIADQLGDHIHDKQKLVSRYQGQFTTFRIRH